MTSNNENAKNEYWGLGATIALSLLILLTFIITQTVVFILYAKSQFANHSAINETAFFNSLLSNGDAVSIAEISATLLAIIITFVLIHWRKQHSIEDYLYLHPISVRTLIKYLILMGIVIVFMSIISILSNHPTPQIMLDIYQSAKHPGLLLFALIIAAPFFEEILFRGFLFEGLRHSSLGFIATAIITSAIWAGIHLQYGLYEIVLIFFVGLLLAYSKAKTGSLYIPIAMHSFMNVVAIVEIELNLS